MLKTHFRQAPVVLLEWAIRVAPPDARVWGLAMQGELNQVEGAWAALMWALGGAGVLVRRALVSLLIPGQRGQDATLGGGLFGKRVSLRGAALTAGGGCVLGALLFFAAPPFRQALRVSMRPWSSAFHVASGSIQPGLEALARRAERSHDAEGLAFCAVRSRSAWAAALTSRCGVSSGSVPFRRTTCVNPSRVRRRGSRAISPSVARLNAICGCPARLRDSVRKPTGISKAVTRG